MEKIKKSVTFVSGSSYNLKVVLTQDYIDLGIFDVYEDSLSPSVGTYQTGNTSVVSGFTVNRLSKLRTFSQSSDIYKKYITSTSPLINGLHVELSDFTPGNEKFVYYLDNMTYITRIVSGLTTTTFMFTSINGNPLLYSNKPIIKDENKLRQIENPRIDPDVFIVRQNIPVFLDNYRLSELTRIEQLYKYGSGYFNIIENI